MASKRVFISHLDTAPARACSQVFRAFGWEVYGTILDSDAALPTPCDATEIIPSRSQDSEAFARGILSCAAIIYDLLTPDEAIAALELVALSPNKRKFICLSSFLTWCRTELPPRQLEDKEESVLEEDLPDEKELEPDEVVELYRAAHKKAPFWVLNKIKKREEEERRAREEEEQEEQEEQENPEEPEEEYEYEEVEEEYDDEDDEAVPEDDNEDHQEESGEEDEDNGDNEDNEVVEDTTKRRRFRIVRKRVPKKKPLEMPVEESEHEDRIEQGPDEELQEPDDAEPEEEYEYEEEWSESEEPVEENSEEREERLLQLKEYGISESDHERRRPHPDFRILLTTEKDIAKRLSSRENLEGAIVIPGLIYGYGETSLVPLYRSIYEGKLTQIPLYFGGHTRSIPTVYALDLALLVHSLVIDACPDKEQPYVFAVERQICTSKQLAEAMGQKLLLPDPLRDKLAKDMDERLRTTKPKPLTKQTFREYVKIRDAPQSLPNYIREVDKEETRLGDSILELTVDSPMILGFASNDLLGGKFPLFARSGFIDNIELSYSEFLAAWGLKPVRIFIQKDPDTSMELADKLAMVLTKYLSLDSRDDRRTSSAYVKDLADKISTGKLTKDEVISTSRIKIIDGMSYTLSTLSNLFHDLAMDYRTRQYGWILIGLPLGMLPEDVFGRPAIIDKYKEYADVGLLPPKSVKHEEGEEEDVEPEEENSDGEEELEEEDVEVDESDRIEKIRERILLPYTAPAHPFTRGRVGREHLKEGPRNSLDFYDSNVSIEHPDGIRIPWPEYIIDLPKLDRYGASQDELSALAIIERFCEYCVEVSGERKKKSLVEDTETPEEANEEDEGRKKRKRKIKPEPPTEHYHTTELTRHEAEVEAWHKAEEAAADIYRRMEHERLKHVRRQWIKAVKKQCIKKINKLAEKGEPGIVPYDSANYTWIEDFNLVGLDPRLDLDVIKIPKKVASESDEVEDNQAVDNEQDENTHSGSYTDENGEQRKAPPLINPDDYDLGIEDEEKYEQLRQQKLEKMKQNQLRKEEKKRKIEAGEEVSEDEPTEEEEEFDETGRRKRTTPKPKPFKDAPEVPINYQDISLPEHHHRGFAWLIESLTTIKEVPYGVSNIFSPYFNSSRYTSFETLCQAIMSFVGPSRGFGKTREERKQQEEVIKRQEVIRRQLLEENLLRKAEEHRIIEEKRKQDLYNIREELISNEERRIKDLSIPIRKYLTQTVMKDLIDGLVEVSKLRPNDPVRYLGEFLMERSVKDIE
ncbi:Putative Dpy-30 motif protein [Giardia duodenalis]|uniref:Putative Dpy-30 motif protein n=1 Tax=Giardia intestinalis TaxID=5741 RepID=V6T8M3_GIAIN|nr:Putative Dpy-30 motif protein [Giardia intestinalis]